MDVRGEGALRSVAHDRRGPGDLVTEAVEHSALDARHGRCRPRQLGGMHGDAFIEIGIQFHVRAPSIEDPSLLPLVRGLLASSNLDLSAIICLTHRKWKQTKSISGQNRIARREMIEADPSIADPDHTCWHVVGDVNFIEQEYTAFPVSQHDDMLDALSRICDEKELQLRWPQTDIQRAQRRANLPLSYCP